MLSETQKSLLILFLLSVNHFMQRPLRDEMATVYGIDQINWLMTGALVGTLLLSFLFYRLERRSLFSKGIIWFLILIAGTQLLFFYNLEFVTKGWALSYFIFTSTTSLATLSLVWRKVLAVNQDDKKLVVPLYAAMNFGALAGPLFTLIISRYKFEMILLPASTTLLVVVAILLAGMNNKVPAEKSRSQIRYLTRLPLKRVALFILLYTTLSTCFYFFMISSVASTVQSKRIEFFTLIDLLINTVVFVLTFAIKHWLRRSITFVFVPILSLLLMLILGIYTTLITCVVALVLFRVSNLSLLRPARDLLLISSTLSLPYTTKHFFDTFIYRSGDALGSWGIYFMLSCSISQSQIAILLIPLVILWIITGHSISKKVKLIPA